METLVWNLTKDSSILVWAIIIAILTNMVLYNIDFIPLLFRKIIIDTFIGDKFKPYTIDRSLSAIAIIPSLLRNQDDYDAIVSTIKSCSVNKFPNELTIMVSI